MMTKNLYDSVRKEDDAELCFKSHIQIGFLFQFHYYNFFFLHIS